MRSPLWTNANHQGQPSKLSEKKKPTEAVFSEENEVFTEGEKETTLVQSSTKSCTMERLKNVEFSTLT